MFWVTSHELQAAYLHNGFIATQPAKVNQLPFTDSVPTDKSAPDSMFDVFSRLCLTRKKKTRQFWLKGQRCDTGIWIKCHQILI